MASQSTLRLRWGGGLGTNMSDIAGASLEVKSSQPASQPANQRMPPHISCLRTYIDTIYTLLFCFKYHNLMIYSVKTHILLKLCQKETKFAKIHVLFVFFAVFSAYYSQVFNFLFHSFSMYCIFEMLTIVKNTKKKLHIWKKGVLLRQINQKRHVHPYN